jgi:hypothetical protein
LRLEQAGTTVARACQIKKCFPVIDQFAGRGEDLDGGVQFKRTVAKQGRVRAYDEVWREKKFDDQYTKMKKLADDLDKLIAVIKPVPTVGHIQWLTANDLVPVRVDPVGSKKPDR